MGGFSALAALGEVAPRGSCRGEEPGPVLPRLFCVLKSQGDLIQRRLGFSRAEARP